MMLVIMMTALAVVVMMLVIMMTALAVVVMMLMIVMTALAVAVMMSVMVMMLVRFLFKLLKLISKCGLTLHSLKQLLARKLIPIGSNYNRFAIVHLDKLNAFCDLGIGHFARVAKHDAACVFYLIVKEFTEVLHVHLALVSVNNGGKATKHSTLGIRTLNRLDNVGKLTYARGLDKDSVGCIFDYYLFKCLGKVTYKRAADTARIHFIDLYSRLGKKSAVNTYLAKLILNKNKLFTLVCFLNKLFYKCCLSRTEKARKNIYSCHYYRLSKIINT